MVVEENRDEQEQEKEYELCRLFVVARCLNAIFSLTSSYPLRQRTIQFSWPSTDMPPPPGAALRGFLKFP